MLNNHVLRPNQFVQRFIQTGLILTLLLIFANATAADPVITATKTDTLVVDVGNDGQVNPGDTIEYTVTIQNANMEATNVAFNDTVDSNSTFVANSLHVSPLAFKDNYNSTGNVGITIPVGSGLLSNDVDPDNNSGTLSVAAVQGVPGNVGAATATNSGGSVTVAVNGSFVYNPPPGFTGNDTFTYNLSDGDNASPNDVDTVTISVSDMIWFIDNSQGAGNGTLNAPFNTLAAFEAVNGNGGTNPAAGHCIFIEETGNGNYTGGVTLENNQTLVGNGASASIDTVCNITLAANSNPLPATAGNRPTITDSGATGVALASNNSIRGLNVSTTNGTGILGNNFGTLNISEANANSSNATAVDLTTGTLDVTLGNVTSVGGTTAGINLSTTTGSFNVIGNGGTCSSAATCTGGSIRNKAGGGNGADGITLNNVTNINLNHMHIANNNRNGIFGQTVNGFKLSNSFLDDNANQTSPDEAGLHLLSLTGTTSGGANPTSITNTTIQNSYENNVKIQNSSGTLTSLDVSGSTFLNDGGSTQAANQFLFMGTSTANMTLNVSSSTFDGNLGVGQLTAAGIFVDIANTGVMDLTVSGSTFRENNVAINMGLSSGSPTLTFDILNNPTITDNRAIGINFFGNGNGSGNATGTISGNTIGTVNDLGSGSLIGSGISMSNEGSGTLTALIDSNTIQEVGDGSFIGFEGIIVSESVTAGTTNVTITNNTIRNIRDDRALQVTNPSSTGTICSNISGNTFSNVIDGDNPLNVNTRVIRVRENTGTHKVVQTSQANLASVNGLANNNITVSGAVAFGAGACATPTLVARDHSAPLAKNMDRQAERKDVGDETAVAVAPSGTQLPTASTDIPAANPVANRLSPDNVSQNIGTMEVGQTVVIIFRVVVNTPTQANGLFSQICNQGTVTADGSISVPTDDPDVNVSPPDATCTSLQTGTINIIKDTVPNGPQDFSFTAGGGLSPNTFSLDDDGTITLSNTQTFLNVAPGSYNISEDDPSAFSYALSNLVCDDGASNVPSSENVGSRTATVNLDSGETVTCTFTNEIDRDWGDLPTSYDTAATTGASHRIGGPYLGACLDGETTGVVNANALGDDNATGSPQIGTCTNPDDEDGVKLVNMTNWSNGSGELQVTVNNGNACLNLWLDFTDGSSLQATGDGDFNDSFGGVSEHIVANKEMTTGVDQSVTFVLPPNAADSATLYLRARLTARDDGGICSGTESYEGFSPAPAGLAFNGEVEDYQFAFTPTAVTMQAITAHSSPTILNLLSIVLAILTLPLLAWRFQAKKR